MTQSRTMTAGPHPQMPVGVGPVVFVATNDPDGNQIIAYRRDDTGALTRLGEYPTGDFGAVQRGAPADPLASQQSLTLDTAAGLLYAVNAGSASLSVFAVEGTALRLRQTLPTDGDFPASVAVRGELVYVLNAGGAGSVRGYRWTGGTLRPIPGSLRELGLDNEVVPFFLSSPGQVGFTPDGRHLVVSTKNHNRILTIAVAADGQPAAQPVVNASAGDVPFAFVFDAAGHLVVAEASGALSSYTVQTDGRLSVISARVRNGQQATCWLAAAGDYLYAVNAGSGTVSGYAADPAGRLRLLEATGISAAIGAGAIDIAASGDGRYLYVQNGAEATVHVLSVRDDGALTPVQVLAGLPRFGGHSAEGIVAA